MSRGNELQEMEVKTQQSKTAANANAKPGDPMPSLSGTTPGQSGSMKISEVLLLRTTKLMMILPS